MPFTTGNKPKNPQDPNAGKAGASEIKYFAATITVGKELVKVTPIKQDSGVAEMKVNKKDLPQSPKLSGVEKIAFDGYVIYDATEQKIIAINPLEGHYEAIAVDMGYRDTPDEAPHAKPREQFNKFKNVMETRMKFYVEFQITDKEKDNGIFFGCTPRIFLEDLFYEDERGFASLPSVEYNGNVTRAGKTFFAGKPLGWFDDDIKFPEDGNILPVLLERQNSAKNKVIIEIGNGFINGVTKASGTSVRTVLVDDIDEETTTTAAPKYEGDDL